ncbi:MarR family winged helix-turn-helix transcriptional regulator [Microbacterium mangrovi]|nr:MarR family winged helix-turn-helix transcriptional regulator [Microbacterium mangrovi]
MANTPPEFPDDVDRIADALSRMRGGRPPWARGPRPEGESGPDGSHGGGRGWGGPPWMHGPGPEGPHHGHQPPPFAQKMHGRAAGLARFRLLDVLAAASGPLTVGELAESLEVDQPRASRLVQEGVAHGLVERQADPEDARRTRVALTETGRQIVQRFRGFRRDAVATALESFTADERADLARLLAKLAAAWPR